MRYRMPRRDRSRVVRPRTGLRYKLIRVRFHGDTEPSDHEYDELEDARTALGLLAMGTRLHNIGDLLECGDPVVQLILYDTLSHKAVTTVDIEPPDRLVWGS